MEFVGRVHGQIGVLGESTGAEPFAISVGEMSPAIGRDGRGQIWLRNPTSRELSVAGHRVDLRRRRQRTSTTSRADDRRHDADDGEGGRNDDHCDHDIAR